jgi:hypothetical protein
MSIKKFISFEDARKELWVVNPDEKYYKHLKGLFQFWGKISKRKIERGIQKGRE